MLGLKDISTFSAFGFEFSKVFLVFGFLVFGFGYHSCLHSLNIEGADAGKRTTLWPNFG